MSELQVTALCEIHDGKLDDFRAAAAACMDSVRERDSGTLQYDWFFNQDQTQCVVRERYRDSDAVIEHIGNMGEAFGALLGTCDLSLQVFGEPSAALVEASSALPVKVYSFFQGM